MIINHPTTYQIAVPLVAPVCSQNQSPNQTLTLHINLSQGDDVEQVLTQLCIEENLQNLIDIEALSSQIYKIDQRKSLKTFSTDQHVLSMLDTLTQLEEGAQAYQLSTTEKSDSNKPSTQKSDSAADSGSHQSNLTNAQQIKTFGFQNPKLISDIEISDLLKNHKHSNEFSEAVLQVYL